MARVTTSSSTPTWYKKQIMVNEKPKGIFTNANAELADGFEFQTLKLKTFENKDGIKLSATLDPKNDPVILSLDQISSVNAFDFCFFMNEVLKKYGDINQGFRVWPKFENMQYNDPQTGKPKKKDTVKICVWFAYSDLHFFTDEEKAKAKDQKKEINNAKKRAEFVLQFFDKLDQHNR